MKSGGSALCPQCGGQLPGGRWGECCPRCLARLAFGGTRVRRYRGISDDASGAGTFETSPGPKLSEPGGTGTDGGTGDLLKGKIPAAVSLSGNGAALRLFGDYELIEELGRGGSAVVWRARQRSLGRPVALKLPRTEALVSSEFRERFRKEASAASSLRHPHIVPIYDFGEEEGQPWIAMAWIEGTTLARLVREQPVQPQRAAELLRPIADAVAHAHASGILHRDIKPSNILLDGNGLPYVADFGMAKRLSQAAASVSEGLTITGQFLGTPQYAPPEQLSMRRGEVGPASDVYALGVVLYEMLTGRPPFLAASLEATLLQVIDSEPVSPRQLNPAVPPDLETICLKCLEKDQARRYGTARELVEELDRFLTKKPIRSRPIGMTGLLWRWCRRNPGWAVALATAHLLAMVVITITLVARSRLAQQTEVVRRNAYAADMNLVARAVEARNLGHANELLEKWGDIPGSEARSSEARTDQDLRGFEWFYFKRLCASDELLTLGSHSNVVTSVAFSPDGRRLASGSIDGEVRLWDVSQLGTAWFELGRQGATGRTQREGNSNNFAAFHHADTVRHLDRVSSLAFSGDGKLLASGSFDRTVRFWDAGKLTPHGSKLQLTAEVAAVAFSEDNRKLGVAAFDQFTEWDLATGGEVSRQPIPIWQRAAISRDFRRLVLGRPDGAIVLWDTTQRARLGQFAAHRDFVLPVYFSPDWRWIAAGSFDATASLWEVATGTLVARLTNHSATVSALAFSPDGSWLATVSYDQTVRLWDTSRWASRAVLKGHLGAIWSVAFSADGRFLATGSKDGTVRLWRVEPVEHQAEVLALEKGAVAVPTEEEFFIPHSDGRVTLRSINAWEKSVVVTANCRHIHGVLKNPGAIVVRETNGQFGIWDKSGGGRMGGLLLPQELPPEQVDELRVSNDGELLSLSQGNGAVVRVVARRTRQQIALIQGQGMLPPRFSADGRFLAVPNQSGSILLWDLVANQERTRLQGHQLRVDDVAFSSDGKLIASAGEDGTVRIWSLETHREVGVLRAGVDAFWSVAFSPDGRRIAGGTGDGRVILWDAVTRHEVATFRIASSGMVGAVQFTSDGRTLVARSPGAIARWRADSTE